jgi:hypothetical protein
LTYDKLEQARESRKGAPQKLSDAKLNKVIEYLSESYANIILDYAHLVKELKLNIKPETLQYKLHQRGYYCCTACQKPYLTSTQVIARILWAIAHIFWQAKWLKVLWSDKVIFLVRRTCKEKVTRKRGERTHPTCIQHQLHKGHITPVNAWGAIGYGYKSPIVFVKRTGKVGAFKQMDYLAQVLEPHIRGILEAFAAVIYTLRPSVEPLFMEDGNPAHGRKTTTNYCAR